MLAWTDRKTVESANGATHDLMDRRPRPAVIHSFWPASLNRNCIKRTACSLCGAPRSKLTGSLLTEEPPSGVTNTMRSVPSGAWLYSAGNAHKNLSPSPLLHPLADINGYFGGRSGKVADIGAESLDEQQSLPAIRLPRLSGSGRNICRISHGLP